MSHAPLVSFFLEYLLLPLLALLLGAGVLLLNYRRHLLSTRQLVLLVVFAVPMMLGGLFGLFDLWFMPLYYLLMLALALLGGVYYLRQLDFALGEDRQSQPLFVYLLTAFILALGAASFSLVFNVLSELDYGLWAMTCLLPFAVPLLFLRAYETLLDIPNEVRKVWRYPLDAPEVQLDHIDYYRLMILAVELHRQPGTGEAPIKVKARTPPELAFGEWFQKFIDDYNYKFPNNPIEVTDADDQPYEWLFYAVQPTLFRLRRYINTDLSIVDNRLHERCIIIAKRLEEV